MKKVLSALLATIMVIALMPVTVFADPEPTYTVSVSTNGSGGTAYLETDPNITSYTYAGNAEARVCGKIDDGYDVVKFLYDGNEVISFANSGDVITHGVQVNNSNHSVVVEFGHSVAFIAKSEDVNKGTVTIAGEFQDDKALAGGKVTIQATPQSGYKFDGWKTSASDSTYVSTEASYEISNISGNCNFIAVFSGDDCTVTTTVNPVGSGTASPSSEIVAYNGSVTLTATPNEGYKFKNWTENGNTEISTNAEYTLSNITSDRNLVANFELLTYAVTATSNNDSLGKVTGSDSNVTHGATITLTATPEPGCHLDKWIENGVAIDPTKYTIDKTTGVSTYSFEVTEAHTSIQAVFKDTYTVNIVSKPTNGGYVTGYSFGEVQPGETINLIAVPNTGYHFLNWTDNDVAVPTPAPDPNDPSAVVNPEKYSFTVDKDHKVVACFAINEYEVTATAETADSTVAGTIEGNKKYTHGSTATLTAKAADGYEFVKWTDGGSDVDTSLVSTDANGNSVYTFTVTEAHTNIVAVFKLKSYTITATAGTGGSVSGVPTTPVNHFETVSLTAIPATGYSFDCWKEGETVVSTDAAYEFTVNRARNLTANFTINSYSIVLKNDGTGTTSGEGTYNHFSTPTVSATPNTGYHFKNWTDGDTVVQDGGQDAGADYQFEVTGPRTLQANFEINSYVIDVTSGGNGAVEIEGGNTHTHFSTATVKATPDTGYHFVYWSENGQVVSEEAVYSFEVDGPRNLVANFVITTYVVAVTAGDHGSATMSGTYEHFKSITLTATPDTGYHFVSWTENGNVVSTNPNYTFTVTGARDLTANFAINYYTVKYVNDDGTVLQETQVAYGNNAYYQQKTTPTKKPTAQFTYTFAGWDNKVTLVTDDVTYTATYDYTINKYKITFCNEDGSVLQTGELEYGKMPVYEKDTPTKASTVQETFTFAGWDKEISKVTGETVYTATYTAKAITKDDVNYKHFTVTFETNGGSEVVAQLVAEGGVAFKPEEPMRERYTFGGWYIDAALTKPFSFATVITSDITLYAKWIKGSQDVDATYAIVGSGSMSWSTGSGEDITVAVERSKDNDSIATHFKGVQIDGAELEYYNYELTDDNSGVIIRADALEGLAVGSHTITILYDDGKAEVELVIADANKPAETVEETTATEAGGGEIVNITTEKSSYLGLWIALAIVAGVVIAAFPIFIIKRRSLK